MPIVRKLGKKAWRRRHLEGMIRGPFKDTKKRE